MGGSLAQTLILRGRALFLSSGGGQALVDTAVAVIVQAVADLGGGVDLARTGPATGAGAGRSVGADTHGLIAAIQRGRRHHAVVDDPVAVVVQPVACFRNRALADHAAPGATGALGGSRALSPILRGVTLLLRGSGGQVVVDAPIAVVVEAIADLSHWRDRLHTLPGAAHALGRGDAGAGIVGGPALLVGRGRDDSVVDDPIAVVVLAVALLSGGPLADHTTPGAAGALGGGRALALILCC